MKSTDKKVSCIIPFYNEKRYIRRVLNVITRLDCISEIVCIDDGSTDHTGELVRSEYPDVKLLRRRRNRGKAEAVKLALDVISTDFVLLVDADLKNLEDAEIRTAVTAMKNQPDIDMIIMRRTRVPWYLRLCRIDTLLSGERLLRASDLRSILRKPVNGYQLEIAIDLYMYEDNRKVYWIPSTARNTFKYEKLASVRSLVKDMKMYGSLMTHAGPGNLVRLVANFGRERLPVAGEPALALVLRGQPR
jgi:glycosyltransferase involved in cell wall biosynthesis